ncbi:MAG: signal peptidase I [Candidatus Nanohaloarchaea archaeon]
MDLEKRWRELRDSRSFEEFYFFSIALILAFGVLSTTGELMKTERPVVTVTSCSMYPEYGIGDIILVKGEKFENYNVGDVVVYDANSDSVNIPIIHRVVKKNSSALETKGDNTRGQHEFEKRVTREQIFGEAVFSLPKVGAVKLLAMDLVGFGGQNIGGGPNFPVGMENTYFCSRVR